MEPVEPSVWQAEVARHDVGPIYFDSFGLPPGIQAEAEAVEGVVSTRIVVGENSKGTVTLYLQGLSASGEVVVTFNDLWPCPPYCPKPE